MKLTDINLNDREEIAAAVALLNVILGETANAPPIKHQDPLVQIDPGAAFAGAAPLAPAGAPSTAGAGLPQIAPAVTPVSLPTLPAAGQMPAAAAPGPAAPAALAVAPSSPVSAVPLDAEGLPWDERIHASSKERVANNTWKLKRGVGSQEVYLNQVKAELRARVAAGAPQTAPAAALPELTAAAPVTDPGAAFAAASGQPAPMVASADPTTFEEMMPRVTAAVVAGQVQASALNTACTAVGLPGVVALQQNPAMVPHVWAALKATYPAL